MFTASVSDTVSYHKIISLILAQSRAPDSIAWISSRKVQKTRSGKLLEYLQRLSYSYTHIQRAAEKLDIVDYWRTKWALQKKVKLRIRTYYILLTLSPNTDAI